ncbi:unnamed protein product [Mytilus coruscus]|uniref:B box-type domain-containing protein n=1 Tax=Mytilus coruscus TaxID=42192 RepID=A0A6J8D7G2_MYTCO|nr:unnamed protein product [Mytilus coruscus]
MASNKSVPCGPCQRGEVNTKAEIWCYNCDEGLCSPYSSLHKKFKSTCYHKTIDIQTYKRYESPMEYSRTECENHSQQFNLYCPSHLMPCCDECISTQHSKCTGIQSLTSVVEKTKLEQSKESVNKDINSFLVFLTTMVNEKSRNVKKGEQQHINIKKSISKIRKKINKHLDHLERKLCKEADTVWDQEKSKLTDLITEFEEKIKTLEKMQDDLHAITVHTSNIHTFL